MSIVDEQGEPVAYGWNDEAATEKCKRTHSLRLISDEEFEKAFPELFGDMVAGSNAPALRR